MAMRRKRGVAGDQEVCPSIGGGKVQKAMTRPPSIIIAPSNSPQPPFSFIKQCGSSRKRMEVVGGVVGGVVDGVVGSSWAGLEFGGAGGCWLLEKRRSCWPLLALGPSSCWSIIMLHATSYMVQLQPSYYSYIMILIPWWCTNRETGKS